MPEWRSLRRRPRAALLAPAPYLPAAIVLAVWVVWLPLSGGYFPRQWYPAAIGIVAMAGVAAGASGRWVPRRRPGQIALAMFAAFVALNFLSIAWAASRASALESADKLLLYLAMAWTVSLAPWTVRAASGFVIAWGAAVTAVCAITMVAALGASDLSSFIFDSRWSKPTDYANSAAAVASMALLPMLLLARPRRRHPAIQGLAIAAATFLLEYSLISQSRASAYTITVVAVAFIALSADRVNVLARLALVVAATIPALGPIARVFTTAELHHGTVPAFRHAAAVMFVTIVIAGVIGGVIAAVEHRIRLDLDGMRAARAGAAVLLAGTFLTGAALGISNAGSISRSVRHRIDTIQHGTSARAGPGSRILVASADEHERYDYWRVALRSFASHPVQGVGAGNFERQYTIHRDLEKRSRYAHDLPLRVLSETGLVGAGLFVALLFAFATLARTSFRLAGRRRALTVTCFSVTLYFVLHSLVDWLDEVPAVATPALAFPFVALAVAEPRGSAPDAVERPRRWSWRASLGVAAVTVAAVAPLALPYLSLRYLDQAVAVGSTDPAEGLRQLERASSLNPWAPQPHLTAGNIEVSRRRYGAARRAFEDAIDIEDSWYPHFELAILDAHERRFGDAARQVARAASLDAHEPLIGRLRSSIQRGIRIDPWAYNRSLLSMPLYSRVKVP